MRTTDQIEKDIIALRDSSLDVNRLQFARLFKELQAMYAKKRTGSFWARVEALGFAKTTAQRWMEEYDREVSHKGKTTRDGSFAAEADEKIPVMPSLRGKLAPALPDGKKVFLLQCLVTEEEHRQLLDAVRILGQEDVKRLVLRAILHAARKGHTMVPVYEENPTSIHA
jgi:hypothetical protein